MDWNLFWTAFGAIGTTAGTFATALAAFLAYKQYILSKKVKLKIEVRLEKITKSSTTAIEESLVLRFINKGIIDLYIKEIAVPINGIYHRIDNFFELKEVIDNNSGVFPVKVTNNRAIEVKITRNTLVHCVNFIYKENGKKFFGSLPIVIIDGQGKEYKKTIKY